MRNQGLGSWPLRRARMTPTATAIGYQDEVISYAQLSERAVRLAWSLRGLGIRAGDRVAYLGPNHPVYLDALFAAGMLGAVFVPLNFRLAASELSYALNDSGAAVLLHTVEHNAVVAQLTAPPKLLQVETPDYRALLAAASAEPIDEPVASDDVCLIMYTSGSTGQPKGSALTHGNLTWNSINVLVESDLRSDEATLVTAPLFHAAALGMTCLPTLLKGGRVILVPVFEPGAVLRLIEQQRATLMFGVPTMFNALSAHDNWSKTDLSSLRILMCGGAPVPVATIQCYLDRGLSFSQGYGMTEAAPGALFLDRTQVSNKIGSAGVPSFFTDVRVVDSDMNPVAVGERGEVVVSGPNIMAGYWGKPEATAEVLREGWFHSGDVATVDADGFVYIVDRIKDVIISGGENIYPAEVEKVLYSHPEVALCAVIGVSDERWGEVGKAVIVPVEGGDPDPEQMLGFLRERLAGYKIPRHIEFVDSLPITGSGKILKPEVRRRHGYVV